MTTVAFWSAIVAGAVVTLILNELVDFGSWFAPKMIRRAAAHMPTVELNERYSAEWSAELDAFSGLRFIKLAVAVHIWLNSWRTSAVYWRDLGFVSLSQYAKRAFLATGPAVTAAWKGLPLREAQIDVPAFALVYFVNRLIVEPLKGNVNVDLTTFDDGSFNIHVFTDAKFRRRVCPALNACKLLIIITYDLCLWKNDIRFKALALLHRIAWRNLKEAEASPDTD